MYVGTSDLIIVLVCFGASLLGPICGIGGGVLIKPVIDTLGVMSIAATSFLSGLSVLTMSASTILQRKLAHQEAIEKRRIYPLAIGSSIGGLVGKDIFSRLLAATSSWPVNMGFIQSLMLVLFTIAAFIYITNKTKIKTLKLEGTAAIALLGLVAGTFWAFLGIGGGPFNFILLSYFFSFDAREAAKSSLVIIAFSQSLALLSSIVLGRVPAFSITIALLMCAAAVLGSIIGKKLAQHMSSVAIDRLYRVSLILIICICLRNMFMFMS